MLATDEARRGVILSLVAAVTTNYLQLRGLDAQLGIANQTLDTYGESLKLFNLQFTVRPDLPDERRAGAVAVRDRRRADPADRVADRADADRAVDPAWAAIPALSSAARRSMSSCSRDVPAGACRRSCSSGGRTLRQAEQALIAANAQIGAAKALYFLTISLTGAFGTASNDLSKLFSGPGEDLELRRATCGTDLHLPAR